jgi:hypothetical protein
VVNKSLVSQAARLHESAIIFVEVESKFPAADSAAIACLTAHMQVATAKHLEEIRTLLTEGTKLVTKISKDLVVAHQYGWPAVEFLNANGAITLDEEKRKTPDGFLKLQAKEDEDRKRKRKQPPPFFGREFRQGPSYPGGDGQRDRAPFPQHAPDSGGRVNGGRGGGGRGYSSGRY